MSFSQSVMKGARGLGAFGLAGAVLQVVHITAKFVQAAQCLGTQGPRQ
jgi:hypothetical protein